ncbi:hypothetical protein HK099_008732 [Clydaea vesicula]|uniref:Cation efflux protein cytoplasmic domain-containing protein n=1 Tax=Clydaea vesicula TaxID=447962 RepID=A0AAD5TZU3_9FUNG|nr:hypothetical protein HK099_008732 [Clydaea vesicula]
MDLASNVVLIYTGKVSKEENNPDKYPTGKGKMETAGIIVFACLMSTLSIQLIIEAVRALLTKDHAVDFNLVSFIAIGIAIFTKFLLFIFCQSLRRYPSANILAQDHRNDIILNSFGVTLSILGAKIESWIDPAGGILIALLIFQNWSFTCYENILLIVGKSADNKFLQKLTYIALTHDDRVRQVDTIRAYTSGNHYFVEVDIVLPPDMTLKEAHDIGESLQIKFETLENVDRAFVHLDFESEHKPEHQNFLKKIK